MVMLAAIDATGMPTAMPISNVGYRRTLARCVAEWGYPRLIPASEWIHGSWFESKDWVAWFTQDLFEPEHWIVSCWRKPHEIFRMPRSHEIALIRKIGRSLGATRLYTGFASLEVIRGVYGDEAAKAMGADLRPGFARWLTRNGFKSDVLGPYLEV